MGDGARISIANGMEAMVNTGGKSATDIESKSRHMVPKEMVNRWSIGHHEDSHPKEGENIPSASFGPIAKTKFNRWRRQTTEAHAKGNEDHGSNGDTIPMLIMREAESIAEGAVESIPEYFTDDSGCREHSAIDNATVVFMLHLKK